MRENVQARLSPFSAWIGNELMPPLRRWLQVERVPFEARALQARARRALSIGEIDEHVHNLVMMHTGAAMRICWAEGYDSRAWIDPNGAIEQCGQGGHVDWIKANVARLAADGLAKDEAEAQKAPGSIAVRMMQKGWIRYSGGVIATFPAPNESQAKAIDGLLRATNPPEGFTVQFFIVSLGVEGVDVPAKDVLANGVAATVAGFGQQLGERTADMGGASDGPFQQGDGQDVSNNFQEQLQDGSTAPTERSYNYMPQDFLPETWWAQQLLQYKDKSYPGKPSVGPQSDLPASGTGPGQQFASAVRTVLVAAEEGARRHSALLREAGVGDPSDTDGQHDLVNEDSMSTHLLDPDNQLYQKDRGRQAPTQEMKTHLGHRWFSRKSDKAVEQKIIVMEKDHLEPGEIKSELRQDGVPASVIDETYKNRDKNLLKVVEVSL
jgi:hypothetical protein